MAAVQYYGHALQFAHEEMKNDKEVVMAAVQNNGDALDYAAAEMKKELIKEAQRFHITPQEYAKAAAHPIIIQLFLSGGNESGGYAGASLTISCRDLGGNEIMALPLDEDAEADKLRSELAKAKKASPAALQLISHRGDRLR